MRKESAPSRLLAAGLLVLAILATGVATRAEAQVRPDLTWRTLRTNNFRIHYNPPLLELARRTAANAEYAYARLAEELVPPRGVVDIVLADNVDFANGYATPYPSNRIVIYARPPVETMALRNHIDWNLVLVTHELAHIFHLDRSRGWWRVAQRVFGRAAPLFPNTYAPSWMTEGLAVHYESQITSGGRLVGTEFPALARAAALDGHLPALHELSIAAPRFPEGNVAYIFGSYAMSRGEPGAVARFVEASSGRWIPWVFEPSARKAYGEGFGAYWDRWRDSVHRAVDAETADGASGGINASAAAADTRVLTGHGFIARFPRWLDDTTLIYVADDARQTIGLYRLYDDATDPRRERLGRRNTIDANSPAGGASGADRAASRTIHAELEWADPYTLRSDLYRDGAGWFGRDRITRSERLSSPDLHEGTGRVVAVQSVPGATHLVTLSDRGEGMPLQLAAGSLDRTWSEPRWSFSGTHVAAARWDRGGGSSIVVLDAQGREVRAFTPRAARLTITSSPAWLPGDTAILFVSDHEGRAMIYRGDVRTGAYARVWSTATALNTPDVSPSGRRIAAVELGADGYSVVTRPMPGAPEGAVVAGAAAGAGTDASLSPALRDSIDRRDRVIATMLQPPDPAEDDRRYWAIGHLDPTWWLPMLEQDDAGQWIRGGLTGGRDLVGRHAWEAQLGYVSEREEFHGTAAYSWAGLGNPVFTAYAGKEWLHGEVQDQNGTVYGLIGQRERWAGLSALFSRPRVRLSTYAVLGAQVQDFRYRTYPLWLLDTLDNEAYLRIIKTETFEGEVGFSTMQRPGLAVSAEDGLAMSLVHRRRLGAGVQFEDTEETIATLIAAKSVPMPGYSRHVFAFRAAYGVASHPTTSTFSVGGVSGSRLELIPGVTYGGTRRAFFVRGFEGNAQLGVRAAAASAEYRAPLLLGGRGLSFLPVFFQKSLVTAFADAGSAWCSFVVSDSFICPGPLRERTVMGSVGAELAFDAALQYDTIYRFRLGVAHPVAGEEFAERANTFYFSLGATF